MSIRPTILIVEDDEAIATALALNLRIAHYEAEVVHDGEAVLTRVEERSPDLILLDINLPKRDGLSVLAELRKRGELVPVVVLSAREGEYDKVAALRMGADDYVTKPFALAELLARIDAVLRRYQVSSANSSPTEPVRFGDVEVDLETRTVTHKGSDVRLTHLEFELLSYLVRHPSRVFARHELLRNVWGQGSGSQRTVDNFVGQLRGKLETDAEHPQHFITIRGAGYRFDP